MRSRMVSVALAVLGVVAVASTLAGCASRSGGPAAQGSAGTGPSVEASTAPPVTDLPDAAFLQLEDLGVGKWVRFVSNPAASDTVAPCYRSAATADGKLMYREQKVGAYKFSARPVEQPDGSVHQLISAYRQGGAAAYLAEVREQVARCASTLLEGGEITYQLSILAEGFAGAESVLWLRKQIYSAKGLYDENFTFVGIIRLRDYVIHVQTDANAMEERGYADRLIAAAMKRAAALP